MELLHLWSSPDPYLDFEWGWQMLNVFTCNTLDREANVYT